MAKSGRDFTPISWQEALRCVGEAYGSRAYAEPWMIEHLALDQIRWRARAMRPPDQSVENVWRSPDLVVNEEGTAIVPYVMTDVDAVAIGRLTLYGIELAREDIEALLRSSALLPPEPDPEAETATDAPATDRPTPTLEVSVSDIDPFHTGGPGRPSAMHIIEAEAKRRIATGEVKVEEGRLRAFSRDLAAWWERERQDPKWQGQGLPVQPDTIERRLRPLWKKPIET